MCVKLGVCVTDRCGYERLGVCRDVVTQGNMGGVFFFLMIRRPPRSTQGRSSAASDVYKRQRHTIQVDFDDYMLDLKRERKRGARRAPAHA